MKSISFEEAQKLVRAGELATAEERREMQKKIRKVEKEVKACEAKIETFEQRLKELDAILCTPEGASDMVLVTEYAQTQKALDEEVARWEEVSMQLEEMQNP